MTELTPVQQYYRGKTIFITGASGFMGKVLLEKLLYSCQELKEIIIICRPKKGKTAASRWEDMCKLPIFQRIKEEKPHVLQKVTVFQGDITNELLGLSDDDLSHVVDNTNIIFHIAASLKMEGKLTESVDMNVHGTRRALDVARKIKNLQAFVHVSTAFCNCDKEVVHEEVYDFHHRPDDLMRMTEWMNEKKLNAISPTLMEPHPNNYTYTKRLSELYVREQYETLPVVIARPSIVTPAYKEPLPGWVDNMNGMHGIYVAVGKGALRSLQCGPDVKLETIPVDFAISGLILIPHYINQSKTRPAEVPVFNLTLPEEAKQIAISMLKTCFKHNEEYPVSTPVWYPNLTLTSNKYYHLFNVILFMWLPALLIDVLLTIFGQKRFMMRTHKRIMTGLNVLNFFSARAWNFRCDNFIKMSDALSPEDLEIFGLDAIRNFDAEKYLLNWILGTRLYMMKEPLSNIPKAKLIYKIMYVLDRVWKTFLFCLFFNWLATQFNIVEFVRDSNPAHLLLTLK